MFSYCLTYLYAVGIKYILRCLNATRTRDVSIQLSNTLQVDCYVNTDFAGLWGFKRNQEPTYT